MIGHRQIVSARLAGYRPSCVFLEIGRAPVDTRRLAVSPEAQMQHGLLPTVWTDGKSPAAADLRFLRGLRVHVSLHSGSSEMFWRWWDAVVEAKPDHAFAVEPDGEVLQWRSL